MVYATVAGKTNEDLFFEYQNTGSVETRNVLIERHLYLADMFAKKYLGRGIDYDDLYQVAAYGILLAIERFDPSRGLQFSTFVTPTIVGEIKRYFRDAAWSLKVPRRLKELSMRISEAREKLSPVLGRIPGIAELAEFLGATTEEVLEALECWRSFNTSSLDAETTSDQEKGAARLEQYLGVVEEGYQEMEAIAILEQVLGELNETQQAVIRKRLFEEMSQRDVADALGISQMTVSRLEKAMKSRFEAEYYN